MSVFSFRSFKPFNGSNIWTTDPVSMNNPSLESYHVVLFKCYAFDHFSCDFLLTSAFFIYFMKNTSCDVVQRQVTLFDVLVYFLTTNGLSIYRSLTKLKNEKSTKFRGSVVQKLKEKCFLVKIQQSLKNMLTSSENES